MASAYGDDCTLSHSYTREEVANVIDATNHQLDDILAWGRMWQVKFAAEKTQAILITRSCQDARLLAGQLGVEVDCHLENGARKASLRVTLLR